MKILKQTIKDRHGNQVTYEFDQPATNEEANGLMSSFKGLFGDHGIPKAEGIPHPGQAQGPDDVPAWLTPGEFVMNAEATRMFEPQIEAMNAAGQQQQQAQGGTIPEGQMAPEPVNPEVQQPLMRSTGGPVPPINTLEELSKITGVSVDDAMTPPVVDSYADVPTPENLNDGKPIYNPNENQQRDIMFTPSGTMIDMTKPEVKSALSRKNAEEQAAAGNIELAYDHLQEAKVADQDAIEKNAIDDRANQTRIDAETKAAAELEQKRKELMDSGVSVPEIQGTPPNALVIARKEIEDNTDTPEAKAEEQKLGGTDNKKLEEEGNKVKDENPAWYERIFTSLKDAAVGMVDDGKLAEAAIVYLGSRALGYGHQGSLRYVGKGYLDRIEKDRSEVKGMHKAGKFTKGSIEEYKETGNRDASKLIPITKSTMKFDATKAITAVVNGKQTKLSPAEVDGNKVFITKSGQVVTPGENSMTNEAGESKTFNVEVDPFKINGTKEWNQRITTNARASTDQLASLQKQHGTFGEGDDKQTVTNMNANTNGRRVAEWAAKNDVAPEDVGGLVEMAYTDMLNYANATGKRPSDIKPFLNQLSVRNLVGNPDLFLAKEQEGDAPTYVDSDKLAVINNKVADMMKANGAQGNVGDIVNRLYNVKADKWANTLTDKERMRYSKLANDNENGFYVFIAQELGVDMRE